VGGGGGGVGGGGGGGGGVFRESSGKESSELLLLVKSLHHLFIYLFCGFAAASLRHGVRVDFDSFRCFTFSASELCFGA
jgi:hypothetical protein